MSCKWKNPREWLDDKIKSGQYIGTGEISDWLISKMDDDTIQKEFQPQMNNDGYNDEDSK